MSCGCTEADLYVHVADRATVHAKINRWRDIGFFGCGLMLCGVIGLSWFFLCLGFFVTCLGFCGMGRAR